MAVFYWIIIVAVMSFFVVGVLTWWKNSRGGIPLWLEIIWSITILLAVFSPVYLEAPDAIGGTVYTFNEDGSPHAHIFLPVVCIPGFSECVETNAAHLSGSVAAITENPKVRRITVELVLEVDASHAERYFEKSYRRSLHSANEPTYGIWFTLDELASTRHQTSVPFDLATTAGSHLYNFFDEYSKELAEFSNPLDKSQVEKIGALLHMYLGPRLEAEGITFRFTGFRIS